LGEANKVNACTLNFNLFGFIHKGKHLLRNLFFGEIILKMILIN
jgi:hypothetical protein